eukprot:6492339-Amphidinium_carterae.1
MLPPAKKPRTAAEPMTCEICTKSSEDGLGEVPWGQTGSKNQALGQKCHRCKTALRRAYPLLAWDALVAERLASTEFAQEVAIVLSNYDSLQHGAPRPFPLENFEQHSQYGLRVARTYDFVTVDKFKADFQFTPEELGMTVDTIEDESGKKVAGVMLRPKDDSHEVLKVEVFRTSVGDFAEVLSPWQHQLRGKQAESLSASYTNDLRTTWPAPLQKPGTALSAAEMHEKVSKHRDTLEAKRLEAEALASALQANTLAKENAEAEKEKNEGEKEDEEDVVSEPPEMEDDEPALRL